MKNEQIGIGDRIRAAIDATGQNYKAFAEIAGIGYRSLQQYLANNRKPGSDALVAISEHLGVSTYWLLTGKGDMYRRPGDTSTLPDMEKELCDVVGTLSTEQKNALLVLAKVIAGSEK
jgi:transcriptional regulator with XRE-family HTH domain